MFAFLPGLLTWSGSLALLLLREGSAVWARNSNPTQRRASHNPQCSALVVLLMAGGANMPTRACVPTAYATMA